MQKVAKVRGLLSATKVAQLSCGWVCGWEIILGVVCAAARMLVVSRQQYSTCAAAILQSYMNICGRFSGKCCCFGGFVEHSPENSRRLLLNLRKYGTFAGGFSVFCCCFGRFLEHLPEIFLRLLYHNHVRRNFL